MLNITQTNKQSQQKFQTRQLIPLTIIFDQSYFDRCTPSEKRILQYFQTFKFNIKKIRHAVVAHVCLCTTKTVQRATNKFKADGILHKQQKNRYSPNNYSWLSSSFVTLDPLVSFSSKKLHIENVQQNKYIKNFIFYKKKEKEVLEKERDQQKRYEGRETYMPVESPVMEERRNFIKIIEKLWELNSLECAKLSIFPLSILQKLHKTLLYIKSKPRTEDEIIPDRFNFIFSFCMKNTFKFAKQAEVDHSFFRAFCSKHALSPFKTLEPRPITISVPRCLPISFQSGHHQMAHQQVAHHQVVRNSEYSPYHIVQSKKEPTAQEKKERAKRDSDVMRKALEDYNGPSFYRDILQKVLEAQEKQSEDTLTPPKLLPTVRENTNSSVCSSRPLSDIMKNMKTSFDEKANGEFANS
jgi:hypothetical protein